MDKANKSSVDKSTNSTNNDGNSIFITIVLWKYKFVGLLFLGKHKSAKVEKEDYVPGKKDLKRLGGSGAKDNLDDDGVLQMKH